MTENKRFVDYFDKDHNYIIQDLQNETEYQVGFANCDEDEFLILVNNISEMNKHLNKDIKALWKYLKPFSNLARDYNLTFKQLYELTKTAIEKGGKR